MVRGKKRMTARIRPGSTTLTRLSPDLGGWHREYVRVARHVHTERLEPDDLRVLASDATGKEDVSVDARRFAFLLALIADVLDAGGNVRMVDSELYLGWPEWTSQEGRATVRSALESVQDASALTRETVGRLEPLFLGNTSTDDIRAFLTDGQFWLEPAENLHPTGASYGEAFELALRYWTMPYRGREGRNRRFTLVGTHDEISPLPVVVGLIEMGDDAPFNSLRDDLLKLTSDAALSLVQGNGANQADAIAERLRQLRDALHPTRGIRSRDSEYVLERASRILERARGRSQSADRHEEKKRLAYLVRLTRGEVGFRRIAEGYSDEETVKDAKQGVRAIHDLTLPRIHLEATICGAVPPFSVGLGGKLTVGFLGDPRIREIVRSEPGSILASLMDVDEYLHLVPNHGLLAITTKGLYPGHSAQYNRASLPDGNGGRTLSKLGSTKGSTTALIGSLTGRLALELHASSSESTVARTYGTGGAKRQRTLEAAAVQCDLPKTLVHAGIRRPVYGVDLISNMGEVVWLLADPDWAIEADVPPDAYAKTATEAWRDRWLDNAKRRLTKAGPTLPGLIEALREQHSD